MCDYAGRLVAWLDGELPAAEATNVEWHIGRCEECRHWVSAYREIGESFLICFEAAVVTSPRRNRPRWALVLGVAAAAATLLAVVLLRPAPMQPLSLNPPPAVHAPAIAFERTPTPAAGVPARRRSIAAPHVALNPAWRPMEPMVQISIPAEAMFPPGAVPAGFSYITEVSFAPGSPQAVRIGP
ncbi:MAG TPA: zf-HC2 domain-containing protein [Bryobacteraceae bacterium]|nr:zf-HC2 domain-containing protein [Bryobacteraceae bacterium]